MLVRAPEHLLKYAAWQAAPSVRAWRHEAGGLLRDARPVTLANLLADLLAGPIDTLAARFGGAA